MCVLFNHLTTGDSQLHLGKLRRQSGVTTLAPFLAGRGDVRGWLGTGKGFKILALQRGGNIAE
jgi:hypothetical protein